MGGFSQNRPSRRSPEIPDEVIKSAPGDSIIIVIHTHEATHGSKTGGIGYHLKEDPDFCSIGVGIALDNKRPDQGVVGIRGGGGC